MKWISCKTNGGKTEEAGRYVLEFFSVSGRVWSKKPQDGSGFRVPTDTSLERGSYLEVVLDAKIYGDMKDILYHTCDAQQKQVLVVHISNC